MMFFRKKKKHSDDNGIEDSKNSDFDDIIIEHTRDRISQELSNFSSIETKAGIIIAANAVIFTLILSPLSIPDYALAFKNNSSSAFFLAMGIFAFAASFALSISIMLPRKKLDLLDPKTMNNKFIKLEPKEIKRQIRHNLIQSFDDLAKERGKENFVLAASFIFMGIGGLGFIVIHFLAHPLF